MPVSNPDSWLLVRPEVGYETDYKDTVSALEFVIERLGRRQTKR